MRRKYLAIGFALITLSAAAAVVLLPRNGADLRGNPAVLPSELWSLPDNRQPPSGNPGGPHHPPGGPQSGPFSLIDVPFDTAKIYVADFSDETVNYDPASEPVGGQGQTAKGAGPKSNDGEGTKGTNDDDPFGSIVPGNGFAAHGGGGFTTLASNETPTHQGVTDQGGDSGGGGGGGGDPNSNKDDSNANDPTLADNGLTETPAITVDEPASLSLLLVGGLALFLARRMTRRRHDRRRASAAAEFSHDLFLIHRV